MVLSHEMIFHHHHHHDMADDLLCNQRIVDFPDETPNEKHSTEDHNHPFPFHHHISEKCDFVYARANLHESNPLNKITTLFVVLIVFQHDISEPPGSENNNYKYKPILISSHFCAEANALRGPPAIV
jgi:hypothetical protein